MDAHLWVHVCPVVGGTRSSLRLSRCAGGLAAQMEQRVTDFSSASGENWEGFAGCRELVQVPPITPPSFLLYVWCGCFPG